jgi:hypothetical protein
LVDVFEAEVAVRVTGDAAVRAGLDQPVQVVEFGLQHLAQPGEQGRAEGRADLGGRLLEVLAGVGRHHAEAGEGGGVRPALGLGVERGEALGQGGQGARVEQAALQPAQQRRLVRQAGHLDRPLDRLTGALEAQASAVADDRDDAEVHARGQPAVDAHLLLAEVSAFVQGGEVEEPEADRFLDLVGVPAGQEDGGDVRLADLDVGDGFGVRLRAGEARDELARVHGTTLLWREG